MSVRLEILRKKLKSEHPRKRIAIVLLILLLIIIWYEIPVTEHISLNGEGKITSPVRFALVTDLHSCFYGKDEAHLIKMIDVEQPDAILLSGDIFDDKISDDNAKNFISAITDKYSCYYVTGNHEFWSGRVDEMKNWLKDSGVTVLDGRCISEEINGNFIDFCGIDDPTHMTDIEWIDQLNRAYDESSPNHYRILLSHRPERYEKYENYYFNLVVAGHAHGGQWRLPFVNIGMVAPDQYLFPRYISGLYELDNNVKMIVSRGLARESMPLPRFFNHPELVIIDIAQ